MDLGLGPDGPSFFKLTISQFNALLKALKSPDSTSLTPIDITVDLQWIVSAETASSSWIGLMYFGISWHDHRLAWNKTDFNISEITLPGSEIWIPDFRDVGLGDGDIIDNIREEMFVVRYDGAVSGQVRRTHKSYCSVTPQYYPYAMALSNEIWTTSCSKDFLLCVKQ